MKSSIDLGLAVSALSLKYGESRSLRELADFCDCKWTNIQQIEGRALRKLRNRLLFIKDPQLVEAIASLKTK